MPEGPKESLNYVERLKQSRKLATSNFFGYTLAEKELFSNQPESIIIQYLKDTLKGTVSSNRIKLLTVGNERHGKTSLLYYLKNGKSIGTETISTDGIDIDEWKITDSKGKNISISRWDFAGQKVIKLRQNYLFIHF